MRYLRAFAPSLIRLPKIIPCLLSLLFLACNHKEEPCKWPENPDFYYWKTNFKLDPEHRRYLEAQGSQTLYIRCFDIEVAENEASPNAPITFSDTIPGTIQGIPVVYITNEVWTKTSPNHILLAQKTLKLLNSLWQKGTSRTYTELQIDCDWSGSTREQFFDFLKELKSQLPPNCTLSATIRLHQFQRRDLTGVPPVNRGILMLYNTGSITKIGEQNSILTTETAEIWLKTAKKYPIPLDLALPAFSWAVVFRLGEFHHIMHDLAPDALQDTTLFRQTQPNKFTCIKNTLLDGYYLHSGDQLRLETVDKATIRTVARRFVAQNGKNPCRTVFFHLDRHAAQTDWRAWLKTVQ
jgi:hypothetical protein